MVGADTRKSANQIGGLWEGLGGVLMTKSVDLWWEHTEVTAGTSGTGKLVSRFSRL